mgnify:FL=1
MDTNDDEMMMEPIEPLHKDPTLLLKEATADELRSHLLDFKEAKLRFYVGLFSPVFQQAIKILANCFRKMKSGRKRGVFALTCCYVFWFGHKPDPCLHVLDDSFRSMHDYRNYAKQSSAAEAIAQDAKDEDDDDMSAMTFDDLDQMDDKADAEALEKLAASMMKKYAKRCGLLDEVYGYITLPTIVCTSHSRPESKVHLRCFWSGGPTAQISPAEQREVDLRVAVLNIIEKVISSKEAEQIVCDADHSYQICAGKWSNECHLSIGCTEEVWQGTWLVFDKAYGRLPYELEFLDQATYHEEWAQYEWRFFVCKAAYEEMAKRHHHKRGILWQWWLKYRDIKLGDEIMERNRKKAIAMEVINDCIDKAFEIMKPKLDKQWREALKPYVKAIEKKKKHVLRQRAYQAQKNAKRVEGL